MRQIQLERFSKAKHNLSSKTFWHKSQRMIRWQLLSFQTLGQRPGHHEITGPGLQKLYKSLIGIRVLNHYCKITEKLLS